MVIQEHLLTLTKNVSPPNARIVQFRKEHIYKMNFDKPQQILIDSMPSYADWLEVQAHMGVSVTIIMDGQPILCFGFIPLWPGVAEAWMLFDEQIRSRIIPFGRGAFRIFSLIATVLELQRLQMFVSSDNNLSIRFAEFCKFNQEGLLKKYGPDKKDYYIYARLY